MRSLGKSASSRFTTRRARGKPTLLNEAVNGFLTGKSVILTGLFYFGGKVLMEVCGREIMLAKEKLMEEEHTRIERLEREIREKRRAKCFQSDTKTERSQRTEF